MTKRNLSFRDRVFLVVSKIKKGNVLTYTQVAERAGSPRACRAVGNILSKNFNPTIPCHRVIRTNGVSGGYNPVAEKKKKILQAEGYFQKA
ncbi:MAG: hypothetical protein A3C07_04860 [Candidatus Sungbacteria bacterium RIFCSPHIGHO2_02_FULL_47_11]|uniref:Methylated-DNA-[protein]-cysteine S-methyltransferase DNA binding domain-containing protein n=1 Tax=Candidatus Sungbacteria bacterium RIFCSPHIGHO2_02_FULL_47_11 TaxID=1802270 RepID=A0A1G2KNT5_9BACT|nr:MAG: hypothetical protein A3C07_04860 [Candidatus Sungbacteria bacterium RIFCSPHIGHO2_02_FULL_47_11]